MRANRGQISPFRALANIADSTDVLVVERHSEVSKHEAVGVQLEYDVPRKIVLVLKTPSDCIFCVLQQFINEVSAVAVPVRK